MVFLITTQRNEGERQVWKKEEWQKNGLKWVVVVLNCSTEKSEGGDSLLKIANENRHIELHSEF